jgi:hypothetical protein
MPMSYLTNVLVFNEERELEAEVRSEINTLGNLIDNPDFSYSRNIDAHITYPTTQQ